MMSFLEGLLPLPRVDAASLSDVLMAFKAATSLEAPHFAGALFAACLALGGALALAWVFQVSANAAQGAFLQAPRVLLLIGAAFVVLLLTLGVFYQ